MFNAAKDALTSQAALLSANKLIARYGKVQALRIDSRAHTLAVTCQLEGETSPIEVRVENYVLETEGKSTFLRATGFTCSRSWLQNVLMDHARNRRFELPPWAAGIL